MFKGEKKFYQYCEKQINLKAVEVVAHFGSLINQQLNEISHKLTQNQEK